MMGIVRMGSPIKLIENLVSQFNIHNFIETGTYQGNTAFLASQIFNQVITIEFSEELYQQAKNIVIPIFVRHTKEAKTIAIKE